MATVELTDRQKQVKAKLEQGKTPDQIAKDLKITTNAVYQQIRRIRAAGGSVPSSKGGSGNKKGGRSSGRKASGNGRQASTPAPATPAPQAVITPERALRVRREEIEGELKDAARSVTEAEKALERAQKSSTELTAKHEAELARLQAAESALKGEKPKAPARKRSAAKKAGSKGGGKGAQATPPAPSQPQAASDGEQAPPEAPAPQEAQASSNGDGQEAAPEPTPETPAPAAA